MVCFQFTPTSGSPIDLRCRHDEEPVEVVDLKTSFRRNMRRELRGFLKTPAVTEYRITLFFLYGAVGCTPESGTSETTRDDFLTFLNKTSGHVVTYTDQDAFVHKVRITDYGDFEFQGRNRYSLDITLEESAI